MPSNGQQWTPKDGNGADFANELLRVILDQESKPIELVVTKNGSEKKLTIVTPMGGVPIFSDPVTGTGKNLQEVLDDATTDEVVVTLLASRPNTP
jgi:hypothetical protein